MGLIWNPLLHADFHTSSHDKILRKKRKSLLRLREEKRERESPDPSSSKLSSFEKRGISSKKLPDQEGGFSSSFLQRNFFFLSVCVYRRAEREDCGNKTRTEGFFLRLYSSFFQSSSSSSPPFCDIREKVGWKKKTFIDNIHVGVGKKRRLKIKEGFFPSFLFPLSLSQMVQEKNKE